MSAVTTVGDRVERNGNIGTVRFIGEIEGKIGIFYGIELDKSNGCNDGSVNHKYYFSTDINKGIFVKKNEIMNKNVNNDMLRVTVGTIVTLNKFECNGIIRFIGNTHFKKGKLWYGIQLEKPNGKNNGTINGHKYFLCEQKYGVFVQAKSITLYKKRNKKKKKHNNNNSSVEVIFGDEGIRTIRLYESYNKYIKATDSNNTGKGFIIKQIRNDTNHGRQFEQCGIKNGWKLTKIGREEDVTKLVYNIIKNKLLNLGQICQKSGYELTFEQNINTNHNNLRVRTLDLTEILETNETKIKSKLYHRVLLTIAGYSPNYYVPHEIIQMIFNYYFYNKYMSIKCSTEPINDETVGKQQSRKITMPKLGQYAFDVTKCPVCDMNETLKYIASYKQQRGPKTSWYNKINEYQCTHCKYYICHNVKDYYVHRTYSSLIVRPCGQVKQHILNTLSKEGTCYDCKNETFFLCFWLKNSKGWQKIRYCDNCGLSQSDSATNPDAADEVDILRWNDESLKWQQKIENVANFIILSESMNETLLGNIYETYQEMPHILYILFKLYIESQEHVSVPTYDKLRPLMHFIYRDFKRIKTYYEPLTKQQFIANIVVYLQNVAAQKAIYQYTNNKSLSSEFKQNNNTIDKKYILIGDRFVQVGFNNKTIVFRNPNVIHNQQ